MPVNNFDVIQKRKRINIFKLGKLWVFKHFFDNRALLDALLDYYNKDQYRFEFKSTGARNNALKLLERNGFDYDLVEALLASAKDAGVKTVLCNHLKIYNAGDGKRRICKALGYDYEKQTLCDYQRAGVFKIPALDEQRRHIQLLEESCRELGLDLITCDDLTGSRNWRDCCGVGDLPGFRPSPWAYYVNGYRITEHTDFETYMQGHDCPWHVEFEQEWNKGKLARSVPELIFNEEDKTYSRLTMCGGSGSMKFPEGKEGTLGGQSMKLGVPTKKSGPMPLLKLAKLKK